MSKMDIPGYLIGGWHEKYLIHKGDGSAVSPEAKYFVLRFDKDPHARKAMLAYAASVVQDNGQLAVDIILKVRDHQNVCADEVATVLRHLRPYGESPRVKLMRSYHKDEDDDQPR